MPRKTERKKLYTGQLSEEQKTYLECGFCFFAHSSPDGPDGYPFPFESIDQQKELWFKHREEIMQVMPPGERPNAWWLFESPLKAAPFFEHAEEFKYLKAHGLLHKHEENDYMQYQENERKTYCATG